MSLVIMIASAMTFNFQGNYYPFFFFSPQPPNTPLYMTSSDSEGFLFPSVKNAKDEAPVLQYHNVTITPCLFFYLQVHLTLTVVTYSSVTRAARVSS